MIIHCLNPSVVDNIPYKFVWMKKMGYREMHYFVVEAYQLRQYQQEENE